MTRPSFKTILPIVVVILLAVLPLLNVGAYWTFLLFLFFIYLVLASMWNLLAGYAGLVSLGQSSFIGFAAYTVGALLMMDISHYLAIIPGGVAAAALCVIVSIPLLRMRGIFFAIGTLVVSEALRIFFTNFKPVAETAVWGGAGIPIKAYISPTALYYLALILSLISLLLLKFILNSKFGLGLMAIRDNEAAAISCGVNSFRSKLYAFILSSFLTGIAASVFYLFQGHVEPFGAFGMSWNMAMLIAVIIGGLGTLEGPLIGAAIIVFFQQMLAGFAGLSLIIEGIIIVVIILTMPKGIMGVVKNLRAQRA
jgi:branched-chain amino acid transport system permease protein